MSADLEFYFDFSSPYGYFASLRVDRVAEAAGRQTVWKPFLLGVVFKDTGARPLAQVPLKGPYSIHDWHRLARYQGCPWVLPDPFPIPTQAAARAFYWLESTDAELAKRFARACYHAYFGEGRSIMAPQAVADVGASLGIAPDDLLDAVAASGWKDKLKEETEAAIRRGVFGSPFFFVDGEGFWGSDRLDMVAEWLARGGW